MLEESTAPVALEPIAQQSEEYTLQYPLTRKQKEISEACLTNITQTDVLLKCVCGAGKTEPLLNMRLHCGKMTIS